MKNRYICRSRISEKKFREILPIIEEQVAKVVTVYTDGFQTYDGLADFGYKKHYRIKHYENQFAQGHNHINSIENFSGLCKFS